MSSAARFAGGFRHLMYKQLPAAFFAVVVMLMASAAIVRAEDGAGTKFFKCRDAARTEANSCWSQADGNWDKFECRMAFELDLLGCDADLVKSINPLWGK